MTVIPPCLLTVWPVVLAAADREASVAAGRQALNRWMWQYPWYDSPTDGVRPIEVSPPWYLRWQWLRDWFQGVLDWLGNLFRSSWGGIRSMSWVDWLAWSLIAVLLIVLVYLMVRALRMRKRGLAGAAAGIEESDAGEVRRRVEALPSALGRKRADLLTAAREHYQQGDYREAIIYLFSYQLVELDKGQLIRLAKGKTNRQYLRELSRRLTLRRLLQETMVAFEEVFFGSYSIDRPRFESVWSRLEEFEGLVAEGAA